jgi:NAD+ diphosphatase
MTRKTHPSRVFSHCPRCGNEGFPFDGENAFNCPSCGLRFYINAVAAVAAIMEAPDGRILLIRRGRDPAAGSLDLPGGFVEIGETAEQAVRREVSEELGVTVEDVRFLASFPNEYEYMGVLYFTCDMVFVCHAAGMQELKPSEEASEIVMAHPRDIDPAAIGFPSIRRALRMYAETR